jgi:hypothetical protein
MTMKYEVPELSTLTAAINAIQGTPQSKPFGPYEDVNPLIKEEVATYQDWE